MFCIVFRKRNSRERQTDANQTPSEPLENICQFELHLTIVLASGTAAIRGPKPRREPAGPQPYIQECDYIVPLTTLIGKGVSMPISNRLYSEHSLASTHTKTFGCVLQE